MEVGDFSKIKEKIRLAETKKIKAEGSLEEALRHLKEEFGCNNIEEAEKKILEIQADIDKGEEDLDVLLERIERLADWENL
jgi:hypothetical protein